MKVAVYFLLILVPCLTTRTTVAQTLSLKDLTKVVLQLLISHKLQEISKISPVTSANPLPPSNVAASGFEPNRVAAPYVLNHGSAVNHVSSVHEVRSSSTAIGFGQSPINSIQKSVGALGSHQTQNPTFSRLHFPVGAMPTQHTSDPTRTHRFYDPSITHPHSTSLMQTPKHIFPVMASPPGSGFQQTPARPRGPSDRISLQASMRPSTSSVNQINTSGKTGLLEKPVHSNNVPEFLSHSTVQGIAPTHTIDVHTTGTSNTISKQSTANSKTTAGNAFIPALNSPMNLGVSPEQGAPKQATSSNNISQASSSNPVKASEIPTTSNPVKASENPTTSNTIKTSGNPTMSNTIESSQNPATSSATRSLQNPSSPDVILSPLNPSPSTINPEPSPEPSPGLSTASGTSISPTKTTSIDMKSSPSPPASMPAPSIQQAEQPTTQAPSPEATTSTTTSTPEPTTTATPSPSTSNAPSVDPAAANLTLSIQRFTESGNQLTTLLLQQSAMYSTQAESLGLQASDFQTKAEGMPFGSPQRKEFSRRAEELRTQQASKMEAAALLSELHIDIIDVFVDVSASTKELAALQL